MSKLVKTVLAVLAFLCVAAVLAIVIIMYVQADTTESSAQKLDDMVEYSFETDDITTDLEDDRFVRIQFQIVADSENAKDEAEKREFQIKNLIIKELAVMKEKNFKSELDELEDTVKDKLNDVMSDGKIKDIYTTNKILQ